jgi:hypothetical protein
VTATIAHQDEVVVDLTLDDEWLETTAHHPFFTQERGWVDAGKLWLGAHVRKADGSAGVLRSLAGMAIGRNLGLTIVVPTC